MALKITFLQPCMFLGLFLKQKYKKLKFQMAPISSFFSFNFGSCPHYPSFSRTKRSWTKNFDFIKFSQIYGAEKEARRGSKNKVW